MNPQISVLSNLRVAGALVLDANQADFPEGAGPGTFVLKDDTLYIRTTVNGLVAWFPLIRAASATYIHTQGVASDVWLVAHGLNSNEVWYQVQDTDGNITSPASYEKVDADSFKLHFSEPVVGTVLVVAANNIDVPAIQTDLLTIGSTVRIDNSGIYINDVAVAVTSNATKIGNGTTLQMTVAPGERLDLVSGTGVSLAFDDAANKITISMALTANIVGTALGYTPVNAATVGAASGVAALDSNSLLPAAYLSDTLLANVLGYTPIDAADIGQANGVAPLDGNGQIAAVHLPSYVDDVIEVDTKALLPVTGEKGKIYLVDADESDENKTNSYRWGGSTYVKIVSSPSSTDSVAEGTTNLYYTDARTRAAVLTGFSLANGTAVTGTDSVLVAVGKLQAQVNANNKTSTDALAEGATNQYFTQARVRATPLTGLSTATNSAVTAADTMVGAIGKLQAQVSAGSSLSSFTGIPYDLAGACYGKPSVSAIITPLIIARACSIPAGMTASVAKASVAPTGNAVFNIKKNGTVVGTLTFLAGQTSGTFAAASPISLAAGDTLDVVAPGSQDATLSDVRLTIAATLA